jgi:hypothetical protein
MAEITVESVIEIVVVFVFVSVKEFVQQRMNL